MHIRLGLLALTALSIPLLGCLDETTEGLAIQATTTLYQGHVDGSAFVTAPVDPTDGGGTTKLYVVGMKVELRAKDALGDTVLDETFTEEGGAFSLDFAHESDKSELELYLKFIAETSDGMIRVRQRFLGVKTTRNENFMKDTPIVVPAASPSVDSHLGEIALDATNTKPHLLHWANRARSFVTSELGSRSPLPTDPNDPLDIMVPPIGFNGNNATSFFVPDIRVLDIATLIGSGVLVAVIPAFMTVVAYVNMEFSDQDAIYIAEVQESDETVFHEFGHYLMWHAQGKKWLDPLEASFSSHSFITNGGNTKIVWTEGFANGFAYIVDSWAAMDDLVGESDSDIWTPSVPGLYGTPSCGGGAGATCNDQGVSHGFFSEYYVGTILYDLWDGPSSFYSGPNNTAPGVPIPTDYDDGGSDATELTFRQIMDPILDTKNTSQNSLVDNIVDYHARIFNRHSQSAITDLFTFNNIRNLHTDAQNAYLMWDLLNSDSISAQRAIEVELYDVNLTSSTGTQIETLAVDVTRLVGTRDDFNVSSTAVGDVAETLHDDLVVAGLPALGAATLSFNRRLQNNGWRSAANAYGGAAPGLPTVETDFAVTLAEGMHLSAIDRGRIMIGEPTTGQRATVTVADGATLTLGGGPGGAFPQAEFPGGPMVSKGKLFIHAGSKLVIERGGTLEIQMGSEILIDGTDAELIIRGDLVIRPGATFTWTATNGGMVTFDLEDRGKEPNVTMDPGSTIKVHEVPFRILDNTYVRPTDGTAREVIIENGARGMFGANAYFDMSSATVTLDHSIIEALGTAKHLGIVLNGNGHLIDDMRFSGGTRCLQETQYATTPLAVTDSTFTGCAVGIEASNRPVGLSNSTISGGTTGLLTTNNPDVGVTNSTISNNAIGWHLVDHGSGTFALTNSVVSGNGRGMLVEPAALWGSGFVVVHDSDLLGNNVGLESNDAEVKLESNTEVAQSTTGVRMIGPFAELIAADTIFRGNATSVELDGARKPVFDRTNSFYPQNNFAAGVALSGTIADTQVCVLAPTIKVTSDRWFIWAGAWIAQLMTTAPYSITTTGGCPVSLVN
ncbi:MAG: right-handed parallel beta-helix repeat-containing protein [Kofleriaceae bacterium]